MDGTQKEWSKAYSSTRRLVALIMWQIVQNFYVPLVHDMLWYLFFAFIITVHVGLENSPSLGW